MTPEQIEKIRQLLPEEADRDFISRARSASEGELGGEFLVFRSERITLQSGMQELMDNRTRGKKAWAARCTCTCCGEDFYTKKVAGVDAIEMYYGDDGCMYTMDPNDGPEFFEVEPAGLGGIQIGENDGCNCPYCGSDVTAISAKRLRFGRTNGCQMAQLLAVGGYAVILYWMVRRHISEYGHDFLDAVAEDAFVLGETGSLLHFRRAKMDGNGNLHRGSGWSLSGNSRDVWDRIYHDWQSINNKKQGTILYPEIPSLVGTTGEKTGLYRYWQQKGELPVEYLKLWKKWPAIENLVNDGLGHLVSSLVIRAWNYRYDRYFEIRTVLDLSKRKPHEMLGLTKEEYRRIPWRQICVEGLKVRKAWQAAGFRDNGARVLEIWNIDRGSTLGKLREGMAATGDTTMDRYMRYLEKQGCAPRDIQLLLDTRDFARRLNGGQPLTREELWPRRLRQVHDRLAEIITAEEDRNKAEEYQRGFDRVLEQVGTLEWTDGELCIRLPRCNADLVREGKTLNHCVGGYGKRHSEGKDLIFFVRRYRRPERSYYTLNIRMKEKPEEIQLHGYGNEYHKDKKGSYKSHRIPGKVRDFCSRWEREVLEPYCREHYRTDDKERSA